MAIVVQTMDDFQEKIKNNALVLVDFYADWCGPCRMIAPKVQEIAEADKNLTVLKVNVDEASEVAEHYKVSAMPTFMFFRNGEKVEELVGASEEKLKAMVSKYI